MRHVPWLLLAAVLATAGWPAPASGDGILEGISGDLESVYSFISTKTKDASGTTTKSESNNYFDRANLRLNYNLFPTLNLNAGGTYETTISDPQGDTTTRGSQVTRLRPYVWLTYRDPIVGAAFGYDRRDDTSKSSGLAASTLSQETYHANFQWRPTELPWTQLRYTHTNTQDDLRALQDKDEDYLFLKSEYNAKGLNAYYAGTYLSSNDHLRKLDSSQLSHEGKLLYTTSFLDGRISLTTDNRIRFTEIENAAELPLPPFVGLSALDDTPLNDPLTPNAALIDGELTASAGVNLGYPGLGGVFTRRNVGLDFLTAVSVNRLQLWVDGWGAATLPADLATWFTWNVYTSSDGLTWTFHAAAAATFGPFLRRFELNFPTATARYLKVVTQPLPGTVIGTTNSALFPNLFVTELQAFVARTPQELRATSTQTFQNYNLDLKAILFRTPSLYYNFNSYYYQLDPNGQQRYNVSNGLFFSQRLTPILSTNANASVEIGSERDQSRHAFLYYASMAATPLKTLTNSLVVSGNNQWVGGAATTSNTVVLYNTAQLYKGVDATLNLGAVVASDEQRGGTSRHRDLYVNLGTAITPHPNLTMTGYYIGKLSHFSGTTIGGRQGDVTENRLDLGLSFTPVRTLLLTATANIVSETNRDTTVLQNYGASWAPFPDGNLQLSFYYAENYFPDRSRILQPSLRWYLGSRRRSYLEASYQFNTTDAGAVETETQIFSASLKIFF